MSTNTN